MLSFFLFEQLFSGVGIVYISSLVTRGCVRATSLGALLHGYVVVLVSDAHSSFSKDAPKLIEKWNQALHEQGAALIETQDVDFGHH
jgi:nicotinamidase-related amidase